MSSGRVRGVPWIHRDLGFYAGMEHPFALNGRLEDDHSVAVCGITGLPPLEVGEVSFDYTTVVGTFPYVLPGHAENLWFCVPKMQSISGSVFQNNPIKPQALG